MIDFPTWGDRLARARLRIALIALATACSEGPPALEPPPERTPTGPATAYGIWEPGPHDSCTREIHDSYSAVGPDRQLYPTWHPPVDPATGCRFGHDHGRDPSGSAIFAEVGPIPFGYANEALDIYDPATRRHEDHVGHKIEWENDVRMRFSSSAEAVFEIRCNVLAKLHQGSHSKDAFTNNLHELAYHIRCDDGTALSFTVLTAIGTPGEFVRSCESDVHIPVGLASPPNSPSGGGKRLIPDRICIERHLLVPEGERSNERKALRESWQISQRLRRPGGHGLASVNPYFNVFRPSRFYDPAAPGGVGRPIEACYEESGGRRARGGECAEATAEGLIQDLPFDDPRSPFNGVHRDMDINSVRIRNAEGPEFWYTDPFGGNAQTQPFPGSIRQFIAKTDNDRGRAGPSGPGIGKDRFYGGPGVHAPN